MSLTSGHLDALVAAGATVEQIVALFKADLAERDTAAARRRDRDRERQRRHRESRAVTVTKRDPAPNEIDILTPTREEKPKPSGLVKKSDRGTRLPDDWEPLPLAGKAAEMVAAWQPGQLERELAKFKNYWPSKGANAARTDWQRTWVNWLIAADERKPRLVHERSDNPLGDAVSRILRTG
jgi:hypothetical protein